MSKKKPTRKTGAAHGNGAAALTEADDIPAGGVRIRMYCQGLGDCFLLTFPPARGRPPFHMLIDCGLILGTPQADERMEQVAESIADETAGTLDLLVGTHEHWDHVSGFVQAQETFGELEIKNTWLAWTEDPKDPLAKKLRKQREDKKQKLALALDHFGRLAGAGPESPQQQRLAGVASFFGLDLSAAAEKGLGKTAQARRQARAAGGPAGRRVFCPRSAGRRKGVEEEPAHEKGPRGLRRRHARARGPGCARGERPSRESAV
jgi:hypothetical protein